jgi:hypothetical protein
MKTLINLLAALSLLLSRLSFQARPPGSEPTPTLEGPTATPALEEPATPTPTATASPNPYPLPGTETPAPLEPTATPTPEEDRSVPTPSPEEPSIDSPLGITASADPAIYIPGKPVYVLWPSTATASSPGAPKPCSAWLPSRRRTPTSLLTCGQPQRSSCRSKTARA